MERCCCGASDGCLFGVPFGQPVHNGNPNNIGPEVNYGSVAGVVVLIAFGIAINRDTIRQFCRPESLRYMLPLALVIWGGSAAL